MILADPNAERFYERSGAVRIGRAAFGRRARPAAALRDQARSHCMNLDLVVENGSQLGIP
jgi:hypothetical protein